MIYAMSNGWSAARPTAEPPIVLGQIVRHVLPLRWRDGQPRRRTVREETSG